MLLNAFFHEQLVFQAMGVPSQPMLGLSHREWHIKTFDAREMTGIRLAHLEQQVRTVLAPPPPAEQAMAGNGDIVEHPSPSTAPRKH